MRKFGTIPRNEENTSYTYHLSLIDYFSIFMSVLAVVLIASMIFQDAGADATIKSAFIQGICTIIAGCLAIGAALIALSGARNNAQAIHHQSLVSDNIARLQISSSETAQRRSQQEYRQAIAGAILSEIRTLQSLIGERGMVETFSRQAERYRSGENLYPYYYHIYSDYFTIFKSHSDKIGLLGLETSVKIVEFYIRSQSIVDFIRMFERYSIEKRVIDPAHLLQETEFLLMQFEKANSLSDVIASLLSADISGNTN